MKDADLLKFVVCNFSFVYRVLIFFLQNIVLIMLKVSQLSIHFHQIEFQGSVVLLFAL